jgi:signal transduction histidine kinase
VNEEYVSRALEAAREMLGMEVSFLSEFQGDEQVVTAIAGGGVIDGIDAHGRVDRRESYCDKMVAGVIPPVVPDLTANAETADMLFTELGIRSYVGVRIERPDGQVEGTLCCLSRSPNPSVADRELDFVRLLARLLGELIAYEDLRRQRDQQREGIAAMALHDLRTPVAVIRGYAELLEDGTPPLDERQRQYVETIRRAGDEVGGLAEQLLVVARTSDDVAAPPRMRVDLSQVLLTAVEQFRPAAADAGLTLAADVREGLTVPGDRDGLLRVFQNLIGNAVKYTPAGGRVDVSASGDPEGVVVEVADDGPGIPAADQERVFEPFYRSPAGREAAPGTGLGLAVCHRIVTEHGGAIGLRSGEDRGTTVTVALVAYRDGSE